MFLPATVLLPPEKFKETLKSLKKMRTSLKGDIGVKESIVRQWETGQLVPNMHNFEHWLKILKNRDHSYDEERGTQCVLENEYKSIDFDQIFSTKGCSYTFDESGICNSSSWIQRKFHCELEDALRRNHSFSTVPKVLICPSLAAIHVTGQNLGNAVHYCISRLGMYHWKVLELFCHRYGSRCVGKEILKAARYTMNRKLFLLVFESFEFLELFTLMLNSLERSENVHNFKVEFKDFFPLFLIASQCARFDYVYKMLSSAFGKNFLTTCSRLLLHPTITLLLNNRSFRSAAMIAAASDNLSKKHFYKEVISLKNHEDFHTIVSHLPVSDMEIFCKALKEYMVCQDYSLSCVLNALVWLRSQFPHYLRLKVTQEAEIITNFFDCQPSGVSITLRDFVKKLHPYNQYPEMAEYIVKYRYPQI